ncbi:MAG: alanine dehydrogenase [Bacteroidetes bacterium]|nr:alanine dehydrogenase [Bacteroidota bacterium]
MEEHKSGFKEIAKKAVLQPQEKLAEVKSRTGGLKIGIPKERTFQEKRIGLSPQAVHLLVSNGHEVLMEEGAGRDAKFSNHEFSEAGAEIVPDAKTVYECPIVMKVAFPTYQEIEMLRDNQILMSALHASILKKDCLELLAKKRITAFGLELLRDTSGTFPVVQSMSEIAGNASVQIASEYLSNVTHGKGVILGGISGVPPSEVVVIGAGTVGQYATKAALGLGALIKVFDNDVSKLKRLQNNISSPVFTSVMHPKLVHKALLTADVVIGAVRAIKGRAPIVITEEMVQSMKPGSVIVDVSIDHGGCIETSEMTEHNNPIFTKYDVIHYCVPNIPSRVARTATYALSNIFSQFLLNVGNHGGVKDYLWDNEYVRDSVYLYRGMLTNEFLGEKFGMKYKDINLLVASQI